MADETPPAAPANPVLAEPAPDSGSHGSTTSVGALPRVDSPSSAAPTAPGAGQRGAEQPAADAAPGGAGTTGERLGEPFSADRTSPDATQPAPADRTAAQPGEATNQFPARDPLDDVNTLASKQASLEDRVTAGQDLIGHIIGFLHHHFPGFAKLPPMPEPQPAEKES